MMRNDDNARTARDLGLAYGLTHKAEYPQKVDRIINPYSELFRHFRFTTTTVT
jgi:hypothetical protein